MAWRRVTISRMKRLRWLLVGLAVLLLSSGGMAAWAYAHRGYPDVVYYQQEALLGSDPSIPISTFDEWLAPSHGLERGYLTVGTTHSWVYMQQSHDYFVAPNAPVGDGPQSAQEMRYYAWLFHALAQGGYSAVGSLCLLHAVGTVSRVEVSGQAALRFVTTEPVFGTGHPTMWILAATYLPLQVQEATAPQTLTTRRYLRTQRLKSGVLPADFFNPPSPHPSLWDQATGWVHDHLGLGH
jgi:hypothetical protein